MKAAAIAAQRGHQVTLFEKGQRPGGQLLLATVPPYKGELAELTRHLITQLEKSGVTIILGEEATAADIDSVAPDVVVLATGGMSYIPEIPGMDRGYVVIAEEVLSGKVQVGERVVVIGGELVGCETAEFLADAGKKVTITRRGPAMAAALASNVREPLVGRLAVKGVTMLTGVHYEEITTEGIIITREGERHFIPADAMVLAAGSRPNTELLRPMKEKVTEVYQVGDCQRPRSLLEALADSFSTALKL